MSEKKSMSLLSKIIIFVGCGFPILFCVIMPMIGGLLGGNEKLEKKRIKNGELTKEEAILIAHEADKAQKNNDLKTAFDNCWKIRKSWTILQDEELPINQKKCEEIDAKYSKQKEIEKEKTDKLIQKELAKLKKECDEVEKTCTFKPKYAPKYINSRTAVYPYFVAGEKFYDLNLQAQTRRSDWLFWKEIILSSKENYTIGFSRVKTNVNDDASASEYANKSFSREDLETNFGVKDSKYEKFEDLLIDYFEDPKLIIRFQGKFYYDYKMKNSEKKANIELIKTYKKLKELAPEKF